MFGGWLRNVDDERMAATWDYVKTLAQRSEAWGYDLTLIAELNLNDIKGLAAPSLDAWSTAASLAAVTSTLELMVAVRPTFHEPALLAKQAASIDHISSGRLSLNVVSSWWAEEARQYGVQFDLHDDRYKRTGEWLVVVDGLWRHPPVLVQRPVLPDPRRRARAEAGAAAQAARVCRRGIRDGARADFRDLSCLRDARRPAGGDRPARGRSRSFDSDAAS